MDPGDPGAYCRDVEAHLCARNGGHLIRIVGPAFELVSGWSAAGVPLSIVRRAVDRACARRRARGGSRRPLRIEYCEADVLDLFDDWKRAVGVGLAGMGPAVSETPASSRASTSSRVAAGSDSSAGSEAPADSGGAVGAEERGGEVAPRPGRRRLSLAAHLERVAARLSAWDGGAESAALGRRVAAVAAEMAATRAGVAARSAAGVRGRARQEILDRLAELDRALLDAARESAGEALRRELREDAERELAPFRERMEPRAFRRAVDAGADRLLVDHYRLPRLACD